MDLDNDSHARTASFGGGTAGAFAYDYLVNGAFP